METKRKRFKRYYFITTYTVISVIIMAFGIGFVIEEHKSFKNSLDAHRHSLIESKKETIREIVSSVAQQLNLKAQDAESEMRARVKRRLDLAYTTAAAINGTAESKKNLEKNIKTALSKFIWENNYIFIVSMDGTVISSPLQTFYEGKNILDAPDSQVKKSMADAIKILKTKDEYEGYSNWTKPGANPRHSLPKYIHLKKFKPLNWIIGYGEYKEDYVGEVQQAAIKQIESISLANNGYIFAAGWDGVSFTKPAKNVNMLNTKDVNGKYIVQDMIKLSQTGGGFYEYVLPAFKGMRHENKLSYVVPVPEWKWYIGTGVYLTDIEHEHNIKLKEASDKVKEEIIVMAGLISAILLLTGVITYLMSSRLEKVINRHNDEINKKNEELEFLNRSLESKVDEKTRQLLSLNASLEERIQQEVEKNREQEHIMFQQGRLASMGEMLSNIAHQWRQPLNNIGLLMQDIRDTYETEEFNEEYLDNSVETCMQIIEHMSVTIDDFRDFFKPDKEKSYFSINDQVAHSITLLKAALENKKIRIITEYKAKGTTYGVPGEYAQVIVNLIGNAKDALIEKQPANPFIRITTNSENGYETLEIEDNGGGIPYVIAEKIFDPYFTTKDEGKGTGIGLYFSKTIIEKNLNGNIIFSNTETGVIFKVSVPEKN